MGRADNYSLLLLAGGKSSRMGTNKAELLYEGRSFLENIIEKAKHIGLQKIYLSGYQGNYEGAQVVYDIYPEIGPLGGIHAGLYHVKTKYCMILPVDIPQIPESFLEDLIEVQKQQILDSKLEKLPLLVERDGFMEPLIGIYPTSMADFVEDRIKAKRFSVFRMLKEWGSRNFVADIPAWQIANINTKEDYEMLVHGDFCARK